MKSGFISVVIEWAELLEAAGMKSSIVCVVVERARLEIQDDNCSRVANLTTKCYDDGGR